MNSILVIRRFKEARSLTGIQSRVAKKLGLSPNHVNKVAIGDRKSDRVMRELIAEVRRVERSQARGEGLAA